MKVLVKEAALTFNEEFSLDYVTLANGTFMYKQNLESVSNSDELQISGDYSGMHYMRMCANNEYLDAETQLCVACAPNQGTSAW